MIVIVVPVRRLFRVLGVGHQGVDHPLAGVFIVIQGEDPYLFLSCAAEGVIEIISYNRSRRVPDDFDICPLIRDLLDLQLLRRLLHMIGEVEVEASPCALAQRMLGGTRNQDAHRAAHLLQGLVGTELDRLEVAGRDDLGGEVSCVRLPTLAATAVADRQAERPARRTRCGCRPNVWPVC
ncbi:hypothetical protein PXH67_04150 [Streptomyces sp. P8-A8]|nr:hypothetical protein [Streptomyces sp. NBC_01767]